MPKTRVPGAQGATIAASLSNFMPVSCIDGASMETEHDGSSYCFPVAGESDSQLEATCVSMSVAVSADICGISDFNSLQK